MNYEGYVSSVNPTLFSFKLDNKVTVHTIHYLLNNFKHFLPNVGEFVKIFNSHYLLTDNNELDKLFLCEKSKINCEDFVTFEGNCSLINLVKNYKFGVSDLIEIDVNLQVIENNIKTLVQESSEEVLLKVLDKFLTETYVEVQEKSSHQCLNKSVPTFNLKTVSSYKYVDTNYKKEKCPPWSFGSHSKVEESDILIGNLQINKRYGLILLYDGNHQIPCLITSKGSKSAILNKFVLIKNYQIFTETYRDKDVPNFEYILFDVLDVIVLNLHSINVSHNEIFYKTVPDDCCFIYYFRFKLISRATVSLKNSSINCWLEVLITNNFDSYYAYLCLNAYQVRVVPYLQEGDTYHVYHSNDLETVTNIELSRLKPFKMLKFVDKNSIFVHEASITKNEEPILSISEVMQQMKETSDLLSFQGLLNIKKLTPSLSSRTESLKKVVGFGTPGKCTHTLEFVDDLYENTLVLYINNWENLQVPLGLIPSMRICVKNVLPQKNKYLKCTAMTTFEVISYEPPIFFDTVNLSTDQLGVKNKFSFLGLGNLIPTNVLVSCKPIQIYIRSLRITYKCQSCEVYLPKCTCNDVSALETTLTFYINDEKGQALVISKSTELLRLLLDLEVSQWKIWCEVFKRIKEYTYEKDGSLSFSYESNINIFCEALLYSIKVINATKLVNLVLECRKIDSNPNDNDGMPLWFCTDAQRNEIL